jgi:hypothetical protein
MARLLHSALFIEKGRTLARNYNLLNKAMKSANNGFWSLDPAKIMSSSKPERAFVV